MVKDILKFKTTIKEVKCFNCKGSGKFTTDNWEVGNPNLIRMIVKCIVCMGKGKSKIEIRDYTK